MKFLLDLPETLHINVKSYAVLSKESMNNLIVKAIEEYLHNQEAGEGE